MGDKIIVSELDPELGPILITYLPKVNFNIIIHLHWAALKVLYNKIRYTFLLSS
jgi:hypothetical protein